MRSFLNGDVSSIAVDGGDIKITKVIYDNDSRPDCYKIGVVPLLSNIQVALGEKFSTFKSALVSSRAPIAFKKRDINKKIKVYEIRRIPTGKIPEKLIANAIVYNNTIIGIDYNTDIAKDKEFRRYVRLSAIQLVLLGKRGMKNNPLTATKALSILFNVPRNNLIVVEKSNTIDIRVRENNRFNLDIHYIASMDNNGDYRLSSIAFNINEAIRKIGRNKDL